MRRRTGGAERLLATVMFTDIVGSTELASALGDRGWKTLISRHNAIVRRELKRFAGRELDTAGDGFFAMFERPALAINCAATIHELLRPLNIHIRAAIHMGEVEVIGQKVGGIAVHAASRLLSLSAPGETYVTGIVHDVVAGSDITFEERGVHELRGVPGEWRVFAVEKAATDSALPVEAVADPAARSRPWLSLAIAATLVVAGVGVAVFAALANPSMPAPITPRANAVLHVDAASGEFQQMVEIDDPTQIVVADDAVWVLSLGTRTLNRIDPATLTVVSIGLPAAPTGIAASRGALWITTGFGTASGSGVLRVGTTSRRVEGLIPLDDGVHGIAATDDALWVTNRLRGSVTRIDLGTEAIAAEVSAGDQPEAMLYGEDAIWVAGVVDRRLTRYEPVELTVTAQIALPDPPGDLALGFGRLWAASATANSVAVIETSTNRLLQTLEMPGSPNGIAAGSDAVWVALASGELVRMDPNDLNARRTIELAASPDSAAVTGSAVWVSIRE